MDIPRNLLLKLKIYSLMAVPYAQAKAQEYAAEKGVPLDDLDSVMLAFVMEGYAKATAATPLALTTMDDEAVKKLARSLIEEAQEKIGTAVGEFIHTPILNEPTLKPGGLTK